MIPTLRCLIAATRYQMRAAHAHWIAIIAIAVSALCWPWIGAAPFQPLLSLSFYLLLLIAPAIVLLGSTSALRILPIPMKVLQLVRWGVILLLGVVAALPLMGLLCNPEPLKQIPWWPTHLQLCLLLAVSPVICFASNLVAPLMRTPIGWLVVLGSCFAASMVIALVLELQLPPASQIKIAVGIGALGVLLGALWACLAEPALHSAPWSEQRSSAAIYERQTWWQQLLNRTISLGRQLVECPFHSYSQTAAFVRVMSLALLQSRTVIMVGIACILLIFCRHYIATFPAITGLAMAMVISSTTFLLVQRLMVGGLVSRQLSLLVSLGTQSGMVLCTLLAILLLQTNIEVRNYPEQLTCTIDGYLSQVIGYADFVQVDHGPRLAMADYREGLLRQPIGFAAAAGQLQRRLQSEYHLPLSRLKVFHNETTRNGVVIEMAVVKTTSQVIQDRNRLEAGLDAGIGAACGMLMLILPSYLLTPGRRSWRQQGGFRLILILIPVLGLLCVVGYGVWNANDVRTVAVSSQFELPVVHQTLADSFALITDEHPWGTVVCCLVVGGLALRILLHRIRLFEIR